MSPAVSRLAPGYSYSVDESDESHWYGLLEEFDDASLYQTWAYGAERWGQNSLSHLVLLKEGQAVAIAQVRVSRLPAVGLRVAYVSNGPLWRRRGLPADPENYRGILRALRTEYSVRRGAVLRILPKGIRSDACPIGTWAQEVGFHNLKANENHRTFLVDLSPPLHDLRRGLHKRWREKLNRAQRNALEIDDGTDDSLYGEFLELFEQMHDRKKFVRFVDVHQFRRVQAALPDRCKMRILIARSSSHAPVAALVWSLLGDTGVPVFSATGSAGLKSHGAYLLRWTMMEQCKELGGRFMDQGGVDPVANPGGYHFKAGMGGQEVSPVAPLQACDSRVLGWACDAAFGFRDFLRRKSGLVQKIRRLRS